VIDTARRAEPKLREIVRAVLHGLGR
jgi:hypothetical protein